MTEGDFELSETEAGRWDAIVASEWPIEATILTSQRSSRPAPSAETNQTTGQAFVTVYQPRRPRLTPLAVGALALAASAWLTLQILIPAYQRAGLAGISRSERAVEVHALTVAASFTALAVVVATGCFGVWAAATAQNRLRRWSCHHIASQPTPVPLDVRPPNPATAATWILLLVAATTAAAWWIPLQLDRTGGSPLDASEAIHLTAMGGMAWLVTFLLSAIGLTAWTSREARHRLRWNANRPAQTRRRCPE